MITMVEGTLLKEEMNTDAAKELAQNRHPGK